MKPKKPPRGIVSHLSLSNAVKSNLFRKFGHHVGRKDTVPETQDSKESAPQKNSYGRVDGTDPQTRQHIPHIIVCLCFLFGVLDFVCYIRTGQHWLPDFGYVLLAVVSGHSLTSPKGGKQSE